MYVFIYISTYAHSKIYINITSLVRPPRKAWGGDNPRRTSPPVHITERGGGEVSDRRPFLNHTL